MLSVISEGRLAAAAPLGNARLPTAKRAMRRQTVPKARFRTVIPNEGFVAIKNIYVSELTSVVKLVRACLDEKASSTTLRGDQKTRVA
jgi:UV DNA damage repair endonuclease